MAEDKRDREGRQGKGSSDDVAEHEVVRAHRGFFPVVYGNNVEVSQGGGMIFVAKDELEIEQGGGQWMIGLRKLEVEQGGCAVMLAGQAEVSRGFIGVLASGRTELKDGSRVLMTLPQALLAGLAAGAVIVAARLWRGNRKNREPERPVVL